MLKAVKWVMVEETKKVELCSMDYLRYLEDTRSTKGRTIQNAESKSKTFAISDLGATRTTV